MTYADVVGVMPFGSALVVVNIDGFTLVQMLEHSVAGFDLVERKGKFLQVSGCNLGFVDWVCLRCGAGSLGVIFLVHGAPFEMRRWIFGGSLSTVLHLICH